MKFSKNCASSTGGSGGDILKSTIQINGNGDVEQGTITISGDGSFTWAPKASALDLDEV